MRGNTSQCDLRRLNLIQARYGNISVGLKQTLASTTNTIFQGDYRRPSLIHTMRGNTSKSLKKTVAIFQYVWKRPCCLIQAMPGNISVRLKETLLFDPDNAWQHFSTSERDPVIWYNAWQHFSASERDPVVWYNAWQHFSTSERDPVVWSRQCLAIFQCVWKRSCCLIQTMPGNISICHVSEADPGNILACL